MRRVVVLVVCLLAAAAAVDAGPRVHFHHWGHWGYWGHWGPYWGWYGPRWATVARTDMGTFDTDISPENASLYLDGRFIGIADDFDGHPDYLYLKPGRYQLEVKLGGYTTETIDIDASAGHWYLLQFKMQRLPGEPRDKSRPQRPKPVTRAFEPLAENQPEPATRRQVAGRGGPGPDMALRPDLQRSPPSSRELAPEPQAPASLRLVVSPDNASVYLDGSFLATAGQLAQMPQPLAVKPGRHTIEVLAPALTTVRRTFDIGAGEELDLKLQLTPDSSGD